MFRTANPALSSFNDPRISTLFGSGESTMTAKGTANKALILLSLVFVGAYFAWSQMETAFQFDQSIPKHFLWVGMIGGLIFAMISIFAKQWIKFTAPIYAGFEGLFLGAISFIAEQYALAMTGNGIVMQAIFSTLCVAGVTFYLYRSQIIKVTDKFRTGVIAATGAVCLVYVLSMVMGFFGVNIPYIHEGGTIGILFSLAVIGLAAMNLILDFDLIENAEKAGAPKGMEWYGAFALLVTLVWLYVEVLRLLMKLQSRR